MTISKAQMTDAATLPSRRTGPSLTAVATAAVCTFLIVLMFLAWQLQAGMDPALRTGVSAPAAQTAAPATHNGSKHVLVSKSSGGG
jgi:hypothetical protein